MRVARLWVLLTTHVAFVIASVFVMDWVILGRVSADLWAVSQCSDALCSSRPLDDSHATTTIWQTLLFSTVVLWQGGSRALGGTPSRFFAMVGFMLGAVGTLSVMLMTVVFARGDGLTSAPLVLAAAYLTGFFALRVSVQPELGAQLATARQVDSARASRRG